MDSTVAAWFGCLSLGLPIAYGFWHNERVTDASGEQIAAATTGRLQYFSKGNYFEGTLVPQGKECNQYAVTGDRVQYRCHLIFEDIPMPLSLSLVTNPREQDARTRIDLEDLFPVSQEEQWLRAEETAPSISVPDAVAALYGIEYHAGSCAVIGRFSDDLKQVRLDHIVCK